MALPFFLTHPIDYCGKAERPDPIGSPFQDIHNQSRQSLPIATLDSGSVE
jgi:hypothetical protein